MDSRYSEFVGKNPTLQERIEAFTSGIISPDTKAITLWAMKPRVSYERDSFYERALEFSGRYFPISAYPVFQYCSGNETSGRQGSLVKFGFVEENIVTESGAMISASYEKTIAGEDFGDAIAASAVGLSTMLTSSYKSMQRIFGSGNKNKEAKSRSGYNVYVIIKTFAQNPKKIFTLAELVEITGLSKNLLSEKLNTLGFYGIIDYESPDRDIRGKRARGFAEYRLASQSMLEKCADDLYSESLEVDDKKIRKISRGNAFDAIQFILDNPNMVFERNWLSSHLKINGSDVSCVLSTLKKLGYLESTFGVIRSQGKANDNTILTWEFLEPIEAVAEAVDPRAHKGFYSALEFYNFNPHAREIEVQKLLEAYDKERNSRGIKGSEEIDSILLSLPGDRDYKLSEMLEFVIEARGLRLSTQTVINHSKKLIHRGLFKQSDKGMYRNLANI